MFGLLAIGGMALGYAIHRLLSAGPVQEGFEAESWNLAPNLRTPQTVCIQLRLWNIYDDETYYTKMRYLGWDEEKAREMIQSAQMWLDSRSVIVAGWREGKPRDAIVLDLESHGWKPEEADRFYTTNEFRPSPIDLVRFEAHEVFEPDMIRKYGLDAEFEMLDLTEFAKVGMDEKYALYYWRDHWEHASWTQVQQMLYRQIITEEDVWDWFRLVEIPPFWRQKLIDSCYHPLTRVDVRRMHRTGVLSDADLVTAYRDVGFSIKNAELMRDFTIAYNASPEDTEALQLTRAQVETAYRIGFIDKSECESLLEQLEYGSEEVEFIVSLIDHGKSLATGDMWISILRSQVKSGLITPQEAGNRLSALGFSSEAVSTYIELFTAYAEQADRLPSKTDIKNWYGAKIITPTNARDYLKSMGYCVRDIDLQMEFWGPQPA